VTIRMHAPRRFEVSILERVAVELPAPCESEPSEVVERRVERFQRARS
jgi:hypothetical protein